MFRTKVLLLDAEGTVPGVLICHHRRVRFVPLTTKKNGGRINVLEFEMEDMLAPITRLKAPTITSPPSIGPGYGEHLTRTQNLPSNNNCSKSPIFLQLRIRLLFGVEMTCNNIASYWFMAHPVSIAHVYSVLCNGIHNSHSSASVNANANMNVKMHGNNTNKRVPKTIAGPPGTYSRDSHYQNNTNTNTNTNTAMPVSDDTNHRQVLQHSVLLQANMMSTLLSQLPVRLQSQDWQLRFTTFEQGFSLNNLYRTLAPHQHLPTLTIIRDMHGHVFGCYGSEAWKISNKCPSSSSFYGNGESFVFKLHPELKIYRWSSQNKLFLMSSDREMVIGGSSYGASALWIDSDLLRGCSKQSETFHNDCLASHNDFTIDGIEFWQISP